MKRSNTVLVTIAAIWGLAVLGGLASLWAYAEKPGPPAAARPMWPAAATLSRGQHQPTLVMFLHPQCACSRASIEELGVLFARVPTPPVTDVVVYRPAGTPAAWAHTDLWASASAIPGVRVTSDEDGAQARLFGAFVSGSTLLYDADGRLLFSGGVTSARGHAGDNDGLDALTSLLTRERSSVPRTPVFGCLIRIESVPPGASMTIARRQ